MLQSDTVSLVVGGKTMRGKLTILRGDFVQKNPTGTSRRCQSRLPLGERASCLTTRTEHAPQCPPTAPVTVTAAEAAAAAAAVVVGGMGMMGESLLLLLLLLPLLLEVGRGTVP